MSDVWRSGEAPRPQIAGTDLVLAVESSKLLWWVVLLAVGLVGEGAASFLNFTTIQQAPANTQPSAPVYPVTM